MRKNSSLFPVEFVTDVFGEASPLAEALAGASRVLIVADANVVQRTEGLGTRIGRYVQDHGITLAGSPVVLSGGEKIKSDNLQSVLKVVSALLESRLGRDDVVLALGGGTILDVAGYAAAQVRGGVQIVRLPTTPAAMVEAAYAEFAAVDSLSIKDALIVPSRPLSVLIDSSFAKTVLDGVWRSGIGEAIRQAVATDTTLLKKLEKLAPDYMSRSQAALDELLKETHAARVKKGATGVALWLANRLEALSGYKLPHGYAVSLGLSVEIMAAAERGVIGEEEVSRLFALLQKTGSLEGLSHSRHLFQQADPLLCGFKAWLLASPAGVPILAGLGKAEEIKELDTSVYQKAIEKMLAYSASL